MPETRFLLPKFLTREVAEEAIRTAMAAAMQSFSASAQNLFPAQLERNAFHVVVLVPAMEVKEEITDWPNYPIQPYAIAKVSHNKEDWPYDFQDIARCKALQLWHGRNDGDTDIMPHLLFSGDTPFWGGVKRNGIVVTCSGVQPWFDRMIAGMTADICIALAYDAWMKSTDKADDELCFLT